MTQVQLETLKLENQHLNDLLERVESRSPKVHTTIEKISWLFLFLTFLKVFSSSSLSLYSEDRWESGEFKGQLCVLTEQSGARESAA